MLGEDERTVAHKRGGRCLRYHAQVGPVGQILEIEAEVVLRESKLMVRDSIERTVSVNLSRLTLLKEKRSSHVKRRNVVMAAVATVSI